VNRIWPPDRKRSEVISYTNSSQRRELSFDEQILRIDGNFKVIRSEGENIPVTFDKCSILNIGILSLLWRLNSRKFLVK
jgi:hypothetical protein